MDEQRKKRGPKPKYEKSKSGERGAPRLITRIDPELLKWAKDQPEGVREYIERLIRQDKAGSGR